MFEDLEELRYTWLPTFWVHKQISIIKSYKVSNDKSLMKLLQGKRKTIKYNLVDGLLSVDLYIR